MRNRDVFGIFSRARTWGNPQLNVKVRLLKILKLSKYPPHSPHFSLKLQNDNELLIVDGLKVNYFAAGKGKNLICRVFV